MSECWQVKKFESSRDGHSHVWTYPSLAEARDAVNRERANDEWALFSIVHSVTIPTIVR